MSAKSLTIGGALVLLCVTLIGRFNGLITDYGLKVAAVVLGCMLVSYIISWALTGSYKKYNWPPRRWRDLPVKRKIFKMAWFSAGGTMLVCGVVVLTLSVTGKLFAIYGTLWVVLSFFTGVTSPWLWPFVFDNVMPRLKAWARGTKTMVVRGEDGQIEKVIEDGRTVFTGEDEALDRPSEVPRE